jgi:divalent metal cation (Fe/Co/Zn/Cd) transporter
MGISIVVDVSRSRALLRVAKKHRSQALEADALHFATDVWSSSVVIGGLLLVRLSDRLGQAWLMKADAVAALVVAGIVVWISVQLGRRSVSALLDGISAHVRDDVYNLVAGVPGVQAVEQLRVRQSGPEAFADLTLRIARDTPLEQAHRIVAQVKSAVHQVLPGADVVVQTNPVDRPGEDLATTVRVLAARHGLGAHGIRLHDVPGQRTLEMHVEVSDQANLQQAHALADALEKELRQTVPELQYVVTHLEPTGAASITQPAQPVDHHHLLSVLDQLAAKLHVDFRPHAVQLHHTGREVAVSFHCVLSADTPITEAHDVTVRIEEELRRQIPAVGRVVIHVEPPEAADDLAAG